VNALQQGQALDQPSNPVMHRKPGLIRRRMPMTAPPTTDCFFEGWGKTAFSASASASASAAVGPRIRRHERILVRIGGEASQRPPIAIMPECG
jgi:hypothetical protein